MESDQPRKGIERLKALLKFIMLRRHKDILHLPKRTDIALPLEFEGPDQARYDQAKNAAVQYLDDIISSGSVRNGYMNAISNINALRMVCNLGCSTEATAALSDAAPSEPSSEAPLEQESFVDSQVSMDNLPYPDDPTESTCTICGALILASPSPGPSDRVPQHTMSAGPTALIPSNGSRQCRSCFSDSIGALESPTEDTSMRMLGPNLRWDDTLQQDRELTWVCSTKIKALVNDVTSQRQANKRWVDKNAHLIISSVADHS